MRRAAATHVRDDRAAASSAKLVLAAVLLLLLPAVAQALVAPASLASADAKITATAPSQQLGFSVAGVGDVNGDGVDDLLVGAPHAFDRDGAAYLFLGPVSGALDTSQADTVLRGSATNGQAGFSVAGAGDVNGDGFDDLLVGARFWHNGSDQDRERGAAHLVLGQASMPATLDLADADVTYIGAFGGDQAGTSVASAGDVDGDGLADILVGAPEADGLLDRMGEAYLFLGSTITQRDLGWTNISLHFADAAWRGASQNDLAGTSVAGGGDVNGDGLDDILVGSPLHGAHAEAGATFLLLSPLKFPAFTIQPLETVADVTFHGETTGDAAGTSVALPGDVDGDGYGDLLVGAPGWGPRRGSAYLFYGGDKLDLLLRAGTPLERTSLALSQAHATFRGQQAGDALGESLAAPGDVDGDGFDDLLIGAPYYHEAQFTGAAYLVHGPVLDGFTLSRTTRYAGEASVDEAGLSVAGAGDVDGDGLADLLIGAPGEGTGGVGAGAAYLVTG